MSVSDTKYAHSVFNGPSNIIFITQKLGATAKNGFHIRILHQKIRNMKESFLIILYLIAFCHSTAILVGKYIKNMMQGFNSQTKLDVNTKTKILSNATENVQCKRFI